MNVTLYNKSGTEIRVPESRAEHLKANGWSETKPRPSAVRKTRTAAQAETKQEPPAGD